MSTVLIVIAAFVAVVLILVVLISVASRYNDARLIAADRERDNSD